MEGEQLDSLLSTLSMLHHDYLTPSSPTFIPLVPDPSPLLEAALSPSLPPTQQRVRLRETRLVQTLYLQVYQILEETYYPQYCQSDQVGSIPIHSYCHTLILPYTPSYTHSSTPSTLCPRPMVTNLYGQNGPRLHAWNVLLTRSLLGDFPFSL